MYKHSLCLNSQSYIRTRCGRLAIVQDLQWLILIDKWLTREFVFILMNEKHLNKHAMLFICVQLSLGFFKHAKGNKTELFNKVFRSDNRE